MSNINIAVIGAGTMGQGIAQLALQAGSKVYLIDQADEQLDKAKANLQKLFARFADKGKITEEQATTWLAQLHPATDTHVAADADLVIEAIVERLDIKQQVFSALENIVAADTILASNTSSLSVTAIASALQRPERFMGLHFFNPPGIMPLVEVVKAVQTDVAHVVTVAALMTTWGKTPVQCKDTPSFIVNRVARPFYVESFRLLEENAISRRDLDACLREGMAFRMGPCELTDFIGQDVNYAVSQSLWSALGYPSHLQPSFVQGDLVAANYLGRKSGRGFYRYDDAHAKDSHVKDNEHHIEPHVKTVEFHTDNDPNGDSFEQCDNYIGTLENGVRVFETDGYRAIDYQEEFSQPVAVIDITDSENPAVRAIAYSPTAKRLMGAHLPATNGLTERWVLMPDRPGLVNLRVISLIINEAATAALQGIADESGIDAALKGGVNYPKGAFEWLAQLGIDNVYDCLLNLDCFYGGGRYAVSPYLIDLTEENNA